MPRSHRRGSQLTLKLVACAVFGVDTCHATARESRHRLVDSDLRNKDTVVALATRTRPPVMHMTDCPRSQTKDRCNHAHAAIIAPDERYLPEIRKGRHQSPLIQLWHCAEPTLNFSSGPERELELSQPRIKQWRTLPQVVQKPSCRPKGGVSAQRCEDGCLKGRPDGAEAYVGLT